MRPRLPGDWGTQRWTEVVAPAWSGAVHAATAGPPSTAPQVVLVHGLGASHHYFAPLARLLAADHRVAAPDLPGFGGTAGPATALDVRALSGVLAAWLRATGRRRAVLVANSAGCQVVVDLAVHSPDLVGPVVLIGPTFDSEHRSAGAQALRLALAMTAEAPSLVPVLVRDYLTCGPRRFAATLRLLLEDRIEAGVAALPGPVVLLRGERDAIAPRRWVADLAGLAPGAQAREVPGAGHALNWSAPDVVAHVVRELTGSRPVTLPGAPGPARGCRSAARPPGPARPRRGTCR